jgi:pimeloyl-ACP methyl ester carboxylesterase
MVMRIELPTCPLIEIGLGKPIVILPSQFENMGSWNSVIHELSTTHKVYVPRLPHYTIPLSSERLVDLVDYFDLFMFRNGIQKPAVIANNIETRLATNYVRTYPDKIGKLILIGSASHPPPADDYSPLKKTKKQSVIKSKDLFDKSLTPLTRLMVRLRLAEETEQEFKTHPQHRVCDTHVIYFDNIFHLPVTHQPKLFARHVRNFLEQ